MTLKVGIIGAGIGGLSTAVALRRTGAEVEIFERSNFQNEIGAAITITPNGMRVLQTLNFDTKKARGVYSKQMRMVDPHSLEPQIVEDFSGVEDDYGAPFMFFHRIDLHSTLKNMAIGDEGEGPAVKIRNGVKVKSADCGAGRIEIESGEIFEKDLIVIADGVHTQLINEVAPDAAPLEDTLSSFYRCLIPMSSVTHNSTLANIFNQPPGFWVPFDLSCGTFVVTYPCRDGTMLNVALRHPTKPENEGADEWNNDTDVEDIATMVERYHPALGEMFRLAESVSVHKVFRRDPLETYARGRGVIIGDAAHPIQPTHAQGAVLAIEEAAALGTLFKKITNPEDVTRRLELYDKILKRRIQATQLLSDAQPGLASILRQRAEDIYGDGIFPASAMNFTKPVRDFFYGWDVMKEAEKVISSS
ncbi:uncharacterized protein B0J16DRAFT_331792 [Fusarium flagelliforme]|uniref:uncharacterized protein n=1 Tax=Fusarium flagelliforme TaxID=2675880 RepID=UPI001E8E812D|nr:uncharacterized protein B0J16DRAFT_331792 [Fusarium flagelliforme]KAH7191807.1 hypothetical protein B0J16DRAFT_331792 [Fusarium flagelliforme]